MYENSTFTINIKTLQENINRIFSNLNEATIIPVLKANAYGHGLVAIAQILAQDTRIKRIAVAHLSEALLLREHNITLPIMILGGLTPEAYPKAKAHNIEVTIYNESSLKMAIKHNLDYHIKIDSGLHRLGFNKEALKEISNIKPLSTYSHFIDGLSNNDLTHAQNQYFLECLDILRNQGIDPGFIHLCDSGAYEWFQAAHYDAVRIGRALYMDNPNIEASKRHKDVATWQATLTHIFELKHDTPFGYNKNTYPTDKKIGILNIGYGDGIITQSMPVYINGSLCTILDSAMDQSYVDLTNIEAQVYDHVEIFGENLSSNVFAKTQNDEGCALSTQLSTRVKRVYTL